jgi:uncharacterized membrane protein YphA (DoxX/SURF4 family)
VARSRILSALRLATALVWIVSGFGFKVLGWVPRHAAIVAVFFGPALAGPLTKGIGLAETALGLWILSGRLPRTCAAVQTLGILAMNSLEIAFARELLLAPWPMVFGNAIFLALGWYLALASPASGNPTSANPASVEPL